MARSPNCTGAPTYQGRVDVSISYPDPDIQTLDTPEALPTSEPATAQVSMTVASSHLATWSPFELEHIDCAILYAAGKNTSGSAITVYYRVAKNGVGIATGSGSVPAGNFYTWSNYRFPGIQIGDVLTCKLWASASGCEWRKKALAVWPSRIGPKGQPIAELVFNNVVQRIFGDRRTYGRNAWHPVGWSDNEVEIVSGGIIDLLRSHLTHGFARIYHGDYMLSSLCNYGATYEFYPMTIPTITRISYTPLNLRVG